MRCLHCGSTLSAFKKLTDADFCSAEHRDAFYGEQQRLILARLKQSADRYHRLRRPAGTGDSGRVPAKAVPVAADAQAPASIAAFLLPKLEAQASALRLASLPALAYELEKAFGSRRSAFSLEQRFCPLVPDFPWPRYNPGLQYLSELLADTAAAVHHLPSLADLPFLSRLAFAAAELLPARRPDFANRPVIGVRGALRLAKPQSTVSWGRVRLHAASGSFRIDGCGFGMLTAVEPSQPPLAAPFLDASPIAVIGTSGIPASIRLSAEFDTKGLAFLDRIYRMRPKFGVLSADVPLMRPVALQPLPPTATTARPASLRNSTSEFEPAQISRFVRSRPRGPVDTSTASHFASNFLPLDPNAGIPATSDLRIAATSLPPKVAASSFSNQVAPLAVDAAQLGSFCVDPGYPVSASSPAFPTSNPSSTPEPAHLDRLFRARPRPVAAETLDMAGEEVALEASASPIPHFPESASGFDAAPRQIDRFFRPRPRGPVDVQVAGFDGTVPESQAWPIQPLIGALPNPRFSPEIPANSTLFRMRPRSGVVDASLAELANGSRPETLLSKPATPPMHGMCDTAPAAVTRMFRMRPRAAVDAETSAIELPTQSFEFQVSQLKNPALSAPPLSAEVPFLDRPQRGRPGHALSTTTPEFLAVATGDVLAASAAAPATPSLAVTTGALAPVASQRMFRGRPRNGVLDEALSSALASSSEAHALLSAPAKPPIGLVACQPAVVDRMFRMRPRVGVGHETTSSMEQVAAAAESFKTTAAIPESNAYTSSDLSPSLLDRLYKGRPRAGVTMPGLACLSSEGATALAFKLTPQAQTQVLADCAPAPVQRLFRFRPKTGIDAATPLEAIALAFEIFPAAKPEFTPDWWDVLHGAKPHFVNKMYRMRMKQPAQDPDTVTRSIRTKHLPSAEAEPVLATLPTPASAAAPSFLDRLYRMRPRGGKSTLPASNPIPCAALEPRTSSGVPTSVLQSISKQWNAAPLRIKSLAATVPILILMAFLPSSSPTRAAENPLREAMSRRAAIDRTANFAEGLSQWIGADAWTLTPSGAIQPSGFALFQPSLKMKDYRFAFSTQVHKGGVGFVVRATDDRNYQAIKLKVAKAGPLPVMRVIRWAVIDGKEINRNEIPLPLNVTADTQYRIALDVNDRSFTLMVQEKVVDFWSEEQLKSGGAGFFGDKGERASIHSVRMTHQDDAIGKLFAALTLREPSSD